MKYFCMLILMLVTSLSWAGGWSQRGTVTEVYNHGYTIMIKMSGTNVDYTDTCNSTAYYALDNTDTSSFDILFSQILMVHASGKEAQFWIDGNTCVGQNNNYQKISTMKSFQ